MAPAQARVVREATGSVLLYLPAPQGDGELPGAGGVQPAHRTRIAATIEAFQLSQDGRGQRGRRR